MTSEEGEEGAEVVSRRSLLLIKDSISFQAIKEGNHFREKVEIDHSRIKTMKVSEVEIDLEVDSNHLDKIVEKGVSEDREEVLEEDSEVAEVALVEIEEISKNEETMMRRPSMQNKDKFEKVK